MASSAAQAGLAGCRIECASGFEADSKTEGWAKDEWKADASWKDSSRSARTIQFRSRSPRSSAGTSVVIQPNARKTTQRFRQQKQKGSMLQTRRHSLPKRSLKDTAWTTAQPEGCTNAPASTAESVTNTRAGRELRAPREFSAPKQLRAPRKPRTPRELRAPQEPKLDERVGNENDDDDDAMTRR